MRQFKYAALLLTLLLAVLCCVPAFAAEGTVTLQLRAADAGSETRLYSVAAPEDGAWAYTAEFAACGQPLDLNSSTLAAALADYAARQSIACVSQRTDAGGMVVFSVLAEGVYLVVHAKGAFQPFLVTVPLDGSYDVNATPKLTLSPVTPTPAPPAGPRLPQTGQLWWPVPVLAVLGLVCVAIGWRRRT